MNNIIVSAELKRNKNPYRAVLNVKNITNNTISNWKILYTPINGSSITECKDFEINNNMLIPKDKIKIMKASFDRSFRFEGQGEMPSQFSVIIEEPFPVDPKPEPTPSPNPQPLPSPVKGDIPEIPKNVKNLNIQDLKPLLLNSKKNTEWNIIKVGHGKSETLHSISDFDGKALKVNYTKDSFKPSAEPEGGIGFYASPVQFPTNEIVFSYEMFFDSNFDPQLGGKLPGIFIGPPGASGGRKSNDNASCRLMWRTFANPFIKAKMETLNNKKIRIPMPSDSELVKIKEKEMKDGDIECEAYVYCSSDQDESYSKIDGYIGNPTFGDSLWRGYAKMKKNMWNKIFIHIKMNTFANSKANKDGLLHLNINGYEFVYNKIKWTENEAKIEGIAFDTFFGGGSDIYASPVDTSIYFRNLNVFDSIDINHQPTPTPIPQPTPTPTPQPTPTPTPTPQPTPTPTPQPTSKISKFNIIKATNSSFEQINTFYQKFKNKYVKTYNQSAYLDFGSGNYCSVSEGQGWLLLISIMMSDRQVFDSAINYFIEFKNKNKMMSWRQTIDRKTNKISVDGSDFSSATDGDMDIIYSLYLGYVKWNEPKYLILAQESLRSFQNMIINKNLYSLKLGDWTLDTDKKFGNIMRSSDIMPVHLHIFQKIDSSFGWNKVLNNVLQSCNDIFTNSSSSTGLMPDFMINENNKWVPVKGKILESNLDGEYNWNSCRIFMRLSTLFCFQENDNLRKQLNVANYFIKKDSNNIPSNIKTAYYLNGKAINNYSALAFTAPFVGSAMISKDQVWLDKLYEHILNAPFESYYEDSIRMICLILGSGNFEYVI